MTLISSRPIVSYAYSVRTAYSVCT